MSFKFLGKKPPLNDGLSRDARFTIREEHYRGSLLEAAEFEQDFLNQPYASKMRKKYGKDYQRAWDNMPNLLRVSAGAEPNQ